MHQDKSRYGIRRENHPRYELRPRKNRNEDGVTQIAVNSLSVAGGRDKRPSPTAVLRHFGLVTYSSFELGCGHYSKVYKAYQDNREIAVKVVRLDVVGDEFKKRFLPRERACWQKVKHRNICKLLCCLGCDEYNYLFMLMEYCPNGDLLTYLQKNGAVSDSLGRKWLRSLLDAVDYLHKKKIAHRDIKAENVLLSRTNVIKLTDFGFACEQTPEFYSRTYCGSRAYSSPEVLMGTPYDVYKNDVWSLGVLCYITMTKSMPFREEANSNAAIVDQQKNRRYRWPQFVALDCQHTVDLMLTFEQDKRPTAKDAKNLPFFKAAYQSLNNIWGDNPVGLYS